MGDESEELKKGTKTFKSHEVEPKRLYAFTLNPNDHNQFWDSTIIQRYELFRDTTLRRLKNVLSAIDTKFEIHLDIANSGRMHWHGYIWWETLDDYYNFLMYARRKLDKWSKIEIDYINDAKIWKKYVYKFHRIKKLIIGNDSDFKAKTMCMLTKYFGNKKSKRYDKDFIADI